MPDYTPQVQTYLCACGCGEMVIWKGMGRKPLYLGEHRKRAWWRKHASMNDMNSTAKEG